jgi:hypothetical protein
MCLALLAPDARRLFDALVLQREVPAVELAPYFSQRHLSVARTTVKSLLLVVGATAQVFYVYAAYAEHGSNAPRSPLSGLYWTKSFASESKTPAVLEGMRRWTSIELDGHGRLLVRAAGVSERSWRYRVDEGIKTLTLIDADNNEYAATYRVESDLLTLEGETFTLELRKLDESACPLLRTHTGLAVPEELKP